MGNTTMQMIPLMQRKLAKYALKQGMSPFGGMGGMGGMGCMPMMPMMPMMPCLPASCCMPMAAPMMAAATPLASACTPLVQNMYSSAAINPSTFMSPASFTSALTAGPMPYRPPASFEFPSNVGMVMPMSCGMPNPLLSQPSFGGFSPQFSPNGGLSCCCCICTPPPVAPPTVTFYPRPVSVPQPCPVPCPVPVPIVNVQQVPVPRPVSVVAPPILACGNQAMSVPSGAPLSQFQGGFIQGGLGQPLVMGSNKKSTKETLLSDKSSISSHQSHRRAKAEQLAASLSNLGLNNNLHSDITLSKAKNRIKSTRNRPSSHSISNNKYLSETDWLTSDTLTSLLNKHYGKTNRHTNSSSLSDHDCIACKQKCS
jgi:hypothetical protein